MKESERPVLLVIDMQSGLFSDLSPELHAASEVLSRVAQLIDRARALSVPIIYTRFLGPAGTPLSEDEPGSAIHPTVTPRKGELVIEKDDSDAFLRTDLDEQLTRLGATRLVCVWAPIRVLCRLNVSHRLLSRVSDCPGRRRAHDSRCRGTIRGADRRTPQPHTGSSVCHIGSRVRGVCVAGGRRQPEAT